MVKAAAAAAATGDMPSFEEDAVRVEKPGVALPSVDIEVERWKKDDVKLRQPPKADDVGRDVNPFSALNSQMSKVTISQTAATEPAREEQQTWRAFDFSAMTTENNEVDDTEQEDTNKELDLVKEDKARATEQNEDQGRKEMDVVKQDEGGKEKQEKKVKLVEEQHEEAKEKKHKEKKEKKADGEDKKEKKEKKDKKEKKNDVDALIKKLEKMDGKIERILAKKQQYELQLKEAKERKLQQRAAENQSVPSK